jgi:hypothetical protein
MQTILTVMVNYYTMQVYIHLSIFDEIQVLGTCVRFDKSNNIKGTKREYSEQHLEILQYSLSKKLDRAQIISYRLLSIRYGKNHILFSRHCETRPQP